MKIPKSSRTDRIGVQQVGSQFERAGYLFREQSVNDYGIDAQIELSDGEAPTGKLIAIQIKSGDSWFQEENEDAYIYRGDMKHLEYWLNHPLPVLIVLCDTTKNVCFWQAILPSNIIYTPTAWKIAVPKHHNINPGMDTDLKRLVNALPSYNQYTIGGIEDVSHGTAKRYSVRIILNIAHTQSEIIDLLKTATAETANCDYHRSGLTRVHWRNQPAHVVWLFIYPSAEDEQNNNFICSSEWISAMLDSDCAPISNGGEEIAPNLKVIWNNDYLSMAKFYDENEVTKEKYLIAVTRLIELIEPLVFLAETNFGNYSSGTIEISELKSSLQKSVKNMDEVYSRSTKIGIAPFECKDLSKKFQSVVAYAHNIYIPFNGIGKAFDEDQIIYNIKSQSQYFRKAIREFEFELRKIQ